MTHGHFTRDRNNCIVARRQGQDTSPSLEQVGDVSRPTKRVIVAVGHPRLNLSSSLSDGIVIPDGFVNEVY